MSYTAQKMKFSVKDIFSNHDQIRSFLRIWSHILKISLMENLCSIISNFTLISRLDIDNFLRCVL